MIKRVYNVADLLKRKMQDYGYQSVSQMAQDTGICPETLWWLMGDKRQSNQMQIRTFHQICKAFDIAPAVLSAAVVRGWVVKSNANFVR